MNKNFQRDIDLGLSAASKTLPSKYFYDEIGDALFVKIMNMPEYYLTKAEMDIFKNQTCALIKKLKLDDHHYFKLVELGAGDGTKTMHLLKALDAETFSFVYAPIDISDNALKQLEKTVNEQLPNIKVRPKQGDYFHVLSELKASQKPLVILFLGSNLGNMTDKSAREFMSNLDQCLKPGDRIVLGLDLIKPTSVVLPAYDDAEGITRQFNLNLLDRVNKELDADFDTDNFDHHPEYDEDEGIAKSFLVSKTDQVVTISSLNKSFFFKANEKIQTEISRKYNIDILNIILEGLSLKIIDQLSDSKRLFTDFILEKQ